MNIKENVNLERFGFDRRYVINPDGTVIDTENHNKPMRLNRYNYCLKK